MFKSRRIMFLVVMLIMIAIVNVGITSASKYPTRPITLVAPFAAGGGVDVFARLLAADAQKFLGQPVAVVNVTGSGGATGAYQVARSRPDGYTLMFIDSSLTTLLVFQDLPFDYDAFEPIGVVVQSPTWIVTPADRPWKTMEEFIAAAKAQPGMVSIGTAGPTGSQLLMGLALEDALGIDLNVIPYSGGGPLIVALAGGHVDAGIIHSPMCLDYVEEGTMRILVAGDSMEPVVYDKKDEVAIFADLNIPYNFSVYRGVFAPKGTSKEVVDFLAAAFEKTAKDPSFIKACQENGVIPTWVGPEEFREILDHDLQAYLEVKDKLAN